MSGADSKTLPRCDTSERRLRVRRFSLAVLVLVPAAAISSHQPVNGYLDFAARHAARGKRTSALELSLALSDADATRPTRLDLDRGTLRKRILQELNIGFLLHDLRRDNRVVRTKRERRRSGFIERKLAFDDTEVGSFEATLLLPPGDGPHPAVLGLHGHHDDDEVFARRYLGKDLALRGYVVLIPRFRNFDCSAKENRIARRLLGEGFTLMGLHVYESMLALRYLADLDVVESRRIGVLSHSGGSSIASLLVRISDDISAQVSDYQVDFRNRCGPRAVHCETLPGLALLALEIRDGRSLRIPRKVVPYGFEEPSVRREIEAFFERHLAL
ncbi:MAG: alpha/beta hydrolase family protein [Thermoanaerobaculia bacterium]